MKIVYVSHLGLYQLIDCFGTVITASKNKSDLITKKEELCN